MSFLNKVFVVTGGGAGIGREVVLNLLAEGAKVLALDISEQGLNETKQLSGEFKDNLMLKVLNITDRQAVEDLPKIVLEQFGKVDGVFNVAGIIQPFIKVNELNFEQIERVMNVNFYGTLYMVKAFLPHLLKSNSTSHIVNVSSMGGFLPVPGQSVYGASKAAVKLLTEGLYAELKNSKVKVTLILPGGVATNITKNSGVELSAKMQQMKATKILTAKVAAEQIITATKKQKFRKVIGSDARFMDKFYRLCPKRAVHLITNKMKNLL
jgi:NADP-dependent 3-hydroxy acid dehydrogenase YdfG